MRQLFMIHPYCRLRNIRLKYLHLSSGYVTKMEADDIGVAAMLLGAGRATKDDEIDLAVGIVLSKKIGDAVQEGEPLAIIHSNTENVERSVSLIQQHIVIGEQAVESPRLIGEMITE